MILECLACHSRNRVPAERLAAHARCGKCKTDILPAEVPLDVESEAEFNEVVSTSTLPVIVDFSAEWCGPCHMFSPEIAKVARERRGAVLVAKVDTDEIPKVARHYQVRSMPTVIMFRGGSESKRVVGAMSALSLERELGV